MVELVLTVLLIATHLGGIYVGVKEIRMRICETPHA
jgi:uncharacterized protein YneF (UPF0154 family)